MCIITSNADITADDANAIVAMNTDFLSSLKAIIMAVLNLNAIAVVKSDASKTC